MAASTPAEAGWSRAVTPHFTIYSDQPAQQLRAYAARLETFDQAVRFARGVSDPLPGPANKLTIYAVRDFAMIERLAGQYGVGGFYIPWAGYSVAFVPLNTGAGTRLDLTSEAVFFHEYAHHLMYESLNVALPLWLTEGFAEFFSTAKFESDGAVGLGAPAAHRAGVLLGKRFAPMPIEVMLGGTWKQLKKYQPDEVYGRGWLLTHYLIFSAARKGQLERYVGAISQGTPALDAARLAFGNLNALDGELKDYVRSMRFPYVTVPTTKIKIGSISIEPLTVGQGEYVEVLMQSRRGPTDEQAKRLAPRARQIASKYPDDPAVQAWLAEAEVDAKNYNQAVIAADRALARDPKSMDALLQKGRALMLQARADKAAKPDWGAIQQIFLSANRLDPEDPRALIGYYESFLEAGVAPPKSAVDGYLYAFELAPQDGTLRWGAVKELINQGRTTEAVAAIKPLAFAPHGGASAQRAQELLETMSSGDLTATRNKIREIEAPKPDTGKGGRKA
ncbi:hypothetical protein G7077_10665 [Sphingomonas piscis]|uniref:DUF1570 domain-containing protein n=1 Tax=Sphingomonas piscis TaxID=2714943 RepID=A0A6G7YRC9_9SPHN|nr:hypothetical protein [Sphingomonas piscis]QIK79293.1 hypothetical protein G7077_10665 [Sphingomonas piscis]